MIAPGTWALVELMGHRQVVGTLSETEVAGTKLLVVDPVTTTAGFFTPTCQVYPSCSR